MPKFNVIQKQRRANVSDRKRALHGEEGSGKLKIKAPPVSISGKRKRKLFKKWRREQKEAVQKGLITMEDVEMAVAEDSNNKSPMKFHVKKGGKLRIKKLKGKGGKSRRKSSKPTTDAPNAPVADAMVE
ncbi:uncharacterized protein LOC143884846 isoform X2 [Tasmannia lanceolata]|uniref:uncharacterized protein LOC143884846 isoform X2 n=1 Tax=Tasmannia lanceolata TaxID=3420 RepID=UPI004062B14F